MLGYVKIDKGELKVREYECYTGYYCGVCKSIGRRYGQLPRMVLSYDAAFLAMILGALDDAPDEIVREHCIAHQIQKKPIIRNEAIDYAADVMLILAWYKLADDVNDENKVSAKATIIAFKRIHRKLQARYPNLCIEVEKLLAELSALENAKCSNLDQVADCFARIMDVIFSEGVRKLYGENDPRAEVLGRIGYHMGRWIYLIDAIDDIEDNLQTGAYNPLFYRYDFNREHENTSQFRTRIEEELKFNLYQYLAVISNSLEEIDLLKNKGILDNVIYFGLNHQTRLTIAGPEALRGADNESI